jgi:MFS family permease
MKTRILFSSALFHSLNDAASVVVPMVFPLLYSQQFIIKKYSHIGLLSNLGLLATFLFQFAIAHYAHKYEYKHMVLFSISGISLSLFLLTFSGNIVSMLLIYLIMRAFVSFYHPVGIAMVSKTHPGHKIDLAMGVQSAGGNLGVFLAFIFAGYLAQEYGWKAPLYACAAAALSLGMASFFYLRKTSFANKILFRPDVSAWKKTFIKLKKYIPGFCFGGACWGTTVYYAPSLLNHRFEISLGHTGIYMALWIGIGIVMTYLYGHLSRIVGRKKITLSCLLGSSLFLFLLGTASFKEGAFLSLFFFGAFLFLIYPAFQSFVGNEIDEEHQTLAFSIVANIQMLAGSVIILVAGFLSDTFGINSPFLALALLGVVVSFLYLFKKSLL